MNRKIKLLISALNAWYDETDKLTDVFFRERPFLDDPSREPVLYDLETERMEVEEKVLHLEAKITKLLAELNPPKSIELTDFF